jgi:O-antigen/teichoic acid export membrane protein
LTVTTARGRRRAAPVSRVGADAWVTIGTVGAAALNYVYTLALTLLLPGDQFAILVAAQALLLVAGTVASSGVPWVMAGAIARAPGQPGGALVRFAVRANVVQGIVAAIVVGVLARGFADAVQIGLIAVATVSVFVATVSMGWAQGRQRFQLLAWLTMGEVAAKVVVGTVLVLLGAEAAGAIAGALGGALAVMAVGLVVMREDLRAPRDTARAGATLVRGAAAMAALQAIVTGAAVIDAVLVVALVPAGSDVTSYTLAALLGRAPMFLGIALSTSVFPALSAAPDDHALVRGSLRRLTGLILPLIAVGATVPSVVLTSVLPDDYAAAHTYLGYTIVVGGGYAIATLQVGWFKAVGAYGVALRRLVVGGVIAVASIVVGAETADVTGLAIGACVGAIVMVALLAQGAGRRWPGAQRPDRGSVLLGVGAAAVLIAAGAVPVLWVLLAAAILAFASWRSLLRVEDAR